MLNPEKLTPEAIIKMHRDFVGKAIAARPKEEQEVIMDCYDKLDTVLSQYKKEDAFLAITLLVPKVAPILLPPLQNEEEIKV